MVCTFYTTQCRILGCTSGDIFSGVLSASVTEAGKDEELPEDVPDSHEQHCKRLQDHELFGAVIEALCNITSSTRLGALHQS